MKKMSKIIIVFALIIVVGISVGVIIKVSKESHKNGDASVLIAEVIEINGKEYVLKIVSDNTPYKVGEMVKAINYSNEPIENECKVGDIIRLTTSIFKEDGSPLDILHISIESGK